MSYGKKIYILGNENIVVSFSFPCKYDIIDMSSSRRGNLKDKNAMKAIVIICFFLYLIPLLTAVSKSCNPSESCPQTLKHSKRYNRAKIKTFDM